MAAGTEAARPRQELLLLSSKEAVKKEILSFLKISICLF